MYVVERQHSLSVAVRQHLNDVDERHHCGGQVN